MLRSLIGLFFLASLALVVVAAMTRGGQATFTDQATVTSNTFTSAACFQTCQSFGAVADTYVKEDKGGDDNFGTDIELKVKSEADKVKRTLVAFNVSSIPSGSTVSSATLTLCLSDVPASGSQGRTEELRLVTSSWVETTVVWNDQPTVSSSVTDTITVPTTAQCLTFSVTADVQAWVDGTTNNGWRLGDASEDAGSGDVKYRSRDNTTSAERPKLDVTYTPP